jgi:hypothetical protein
MRKSKSGGKGMVNPYPQKLKPGYPKTTEGVTKSADGPAGYPRENFAGKTFTKKGY